MLRLTYPSGKLDKTSPSGASMNDQQEHSLPTGGLRKDLQNTETLTPVADITLMNKESTLYSLRQSLHTSLTVEPPNGIKHFTFHPCSNEEDYWKIFKCLKHVRSHANLTHLRAGLLFGESNFLSLLPILAELVDVILLADIEAELHEHTLFLLTTFIESTSTKEFLQNYCRNNPNSNFSLGDELPSRKGLSVYADRILGENSCGYKSLGKYHFLTTQARYDTCKQALAKVSIIQINFNLMNMSACRRLTKLLRAHNIQITLCNFTNIHHYVDAHKLRATTSELLKDASQSIVMYAKGPVDKLKTDFSVGLKDYYADCLRLRPAQVAASIPGDAANSYLFFFPKVRKNRIQGPCYIVLLASGSGEKFVELMVNGEIDINGMSKIHAYETYEEAVAFAEEDIRTSLMLTSYFICTLNINCRNDDGEWQHYPFTPTNPNRYSAAYFARKITKVTSNTGSIVFERSPDFFEDRARSLFA